MLCDVVLTVLQILLKGLLQHALPDPPLPCPQVSNSVGLGGGLRVWGHNSQEKMMTLTLALILWKPLF